ncbi:unnamed protein product [Prorocentrum cordatum]|uniref:Uncharacterized protein n=1 Tax=Prorocentrum cordatum TaxID=2364126 RepID=A0ABN9VDI4_9DINO|nr:unnamed protein product [Polarella glacialis]
MRSCAQHAANLPEDGAPLSARRPAEQGPRLGEQLEGPTTLPEVPMGLDVVDLEADLLARAALRAPDEDGDDCAFGGGSFVEAPAAGEGRAASSAADARSAALAECAGDGPGDRCNECLAPGDWLVHQHAGVEAFVEGLASGWRLAEQRVRQQVQDVRDELKELLVGSLANIRGTLQFSEQVRAGSRSCRSVQKLRGLMSDWRSHDAAATQHLAKLMDTVKAWAGLLRSGRDGVVASDGFATVERTEADRQSESVPMSDCDGEADAVAEADPLQRRRSQREQDVDDLMKAFCTERSWLERSHSACDP